MLVGWIFGSQNQLALAQLSDLAFGDSDCHVEVVSWHMFSDLFLTA